jgi:hypothetical protein
MAIVSVNLTSDSLAYMARLLTLGAISGASPNVSINPTIRPLVDALYEVLARGSVTVSAPGQLTIRQAFQQL